MTRLVFQQFYLDCLSHASYLVGDRHTGRAVVVDPQRDIGGYLDAARDAGLLIERVIETHVHADFLSGHLELAEATGARISYGSAAQVDFPIDPLDDGTRVSLGGVDLEIMHTPGHTPESICVVVREHPDAAPYGVLTGDTLFIGDVGRPDLLGANGWSAEDLARALYRSTRERLLTLPDATRVFPAHGAGSACGKSLSTETSSTIGEQRTANYALAPMSEDEFVHAVCDGQSIAPMYFAFASHRNRENRPTFHEDLPVPIVDSLDGVTVLDTRDPDDFARGHVAGAINVGLDGRFADLTGQVLRFDAPIVLVCEPGRAEEARNRLARIGFDRVLGRWDKPGDVTTRRLSPSDLESTTARLVDVRAAGEVESAGTIPGALHVPLTELLKRLDELDPAEPTVVYCAGGFRSSVAASVLRANGFTDVADLAGGYNAWRDARVETV
ncbi:Glyoxylase, beta-lactamase superfamily II [Actinokineospora alba]|uniref:Glyoxylase, beta-lactamase superfamily II n=1 Tax=Actinokineospora alba TaxID=504798 RepID=A0A1H0N9W4_9PSEU|nr:MBL fold metallo-hydrolase [Actinokineospora alba]TDP68627.1 glyoxylase-like metal-dependent hydrolase (beta-lactamase superfamily II) [Actinokineospora alba]SDH83138.1 Glyoxylase, beta-lactamase superfamily II [Actinokineospora alba]SDO89205.1 Glyoxylase, beta-lactamase superfamily II [Actinokineospora alba]